MIVTAPARSAPQNTTRPVLEYQSGFGNVHGTEAVPGALPVGQNAPQQPPKGLYAEVISGTSFTAPRAENLSAWLYRLRPSAMHAPFRRVDDRAIRSGPFDEVETPPNRLRWNPLPIPNAPADFLDELITLAGSGVRGPGREVRGDQQVHERAVGRRVEPLAARRGGLARPLRAVQVRSRALHDDQHGELRSRRPVDLHCPELAFRAAGRGELRLRHLPAALAGGRAHLQAAVVPQERDERADGPRARRLRREGERLSARRRLDPQLHGGARARPRDLRQGLGGRAQAAEDREQPRLHVGVALGVAAHQARAEGARAAEGLRQRLGRVQKGDRFLKIGVRARFIPSLTADFCDARMKSQKPLENKCHMSKTLAELKEKASRLSEVERAELALSLIESLDGPPDEGADEAWRVEIERRIGQLERGEVELIPG